MSGTGEDLGVAFAIARDRWGAPKWVLFRETPEGAPRRVKLSFVRGVAEGAIRLAGPREGFHITRVGP